MSTSRGKYGDPRKRKSASGVGLPVIAACLPVDQAKLHPLPLGTPSPTPMIDDTLRPCVGCGQDCWVGPKKLELAGRGEAIILCYLCAIAAVRGSATIVDLNPDRVEQPRR